MNRHLRVLAVLLGAAAVLAQAPITATPLPPPPGTEPRTPPSPTVEPRPPPPGPPPIGAPQPGSSQLGSSQPGLSQPGLPQTPTPQPDTAPQAPSRQPIAGTWVPRGAAELQVLDKVNARSTTLTVKPGESTRFETLTISVRGCVVRGPDQAPDTAAFVSVTDSLGAASPFSGWIVQSAPAASMLQHPIYDVRVAGCTP